MKIRFQADADLNEDIVSGVRRREPSVDFQTGIGGESQGSARHNSPGVGGTGGTHLSLTRSQDHASLLCPVNTNNNEPWAVNCLTKGGPSCRNRRAHSHLGGVRDGGMGE